MANTAKPSAPPIDDEDENDTPQASAPPLEDIEDDDAAAPPSKLMTGDWINTAYTILNGKLGIAKFNQAIPMIVSAIAIGISIVNRNFPKCIGHVVGATIVALISAVIISRMNNDTLLCNQFTTAFLWYTICYVAFCIQSSKTIDDVSLVGIILSFVILVFIDFVTFLGGVCETIGPATYIGMMLMGVIGGIGGFYATQSIGGNGALYDFSGCSCDDCAAKQKCSINSKPRSIMLKQLSTPAN
jgi:hypothetical protein